jgi:4-diphosphocytidyl-2-C-methyl-D-erythritol kinase
MAGDPLDPHALRAIGARIGADVPSQIEPRHALVTGAGEGVEPLDLPPLALVLVPQDRGLSTADVYREADRIGATRARLDPDSLRALARAPLTGLAAGLENDLERAALSLRPELAAELDALRAAGALAARITGSGPTAYGVFATRGDAEQAAAGLQSNSLVTVTRHQPPAQ